MTWNIFASLSTIDSLYWDQNYSALAQLAPVACTVSGTNTIAMITLSGGPAVTAYANYSIYSGIAAQTNTGTVVASVGALAALNVYKDSPLGPVALVANDIIANNTIYLVYDSSLNAGAGGFHLLNPAMVNATGGTISGNLLVQGVANLTKMEINSGASITRMLSTTASLSFSSIVGPGTSDTSVTLTGVSIGDIVVVAPPGSIVSNLVLTGFVPLANIVTLRASVLTGTVTPAAGSYRLTALGYY